MGALLVRSQTSQGAFPASTQHRVYQYGWLRDGSWCAYALDRVSRASAAAAWHRWIRQITCGGPVNAVSAASGMAASNAEYL